MTNTIYLNHMAAPAVTARELLQFCGELGFSGAELRNDIAAGDPFCGEPAEKLGRYADSLGLDLLTINALQQCNRSEGVPMLLQSLQDIAKPARQAGVSAIVMCPVNDRSDPRTAQESLRDLERNLRAFVPVLAEYGLTGLVEPLGFPQSSLRSQRTALEVIDRIGSDRLALLLDTFHFALGPDTFTDLEQYPVSRIGLVHVSGVEEDLSRDRMTDDHRLLSGPGDRLETIQQLKTLIGRGYTGPLALEPFAARYGGLSRTELRKEIGAGLFYLRQNL